MWTRLPSCIQFFFFFNDTATTEIYTLSLHDALPISPPAPSHDRRRPPGRRERRSVEAPQPRSEEHTSELQSPCNLVCRLLLEKKKNTSNRKHGSPPPAAPRSRFATHYAPLIVVHSDI